MSRYDNLYRRSIRDPERYWGEVAEQCHWYKKWHTVLDDSNPPFFRYFAGGKTNLCYNALDRHVNNGLSETPALIWEGAAQGLTRVITYGELYREVNRFAGVLQALGIGKGDRVFMFMPTVPEAVYAMLACVRIGAMHVGVFTGYGPGAIAKRIRNARPRIALTADGSFRRNRAVPLKETLDAAMQNAPIGKVVVLNRGIAPYKMVPGRDLDWAQLLEQYGKDYVEPLPVESEHPSHIVFTSGDTGNPRGVVNDTGGYMVGLHNSMPVIYGVHPGDVYWATSDIGWRLGHNYICYAPLLYGVTSLMFEGTPDYPDHAVYWRMIQKHKVAVIFSVPTIWKMLERFGIEHARKHDTGSLRLLFLAGECLDPHTWEWSTEAIGGKPVIDHYWLTETGWPMLSVMAGVGMLPLKPGFANKPCIGWDMDVVDREGNPLPPNKKGLLVVRPPFPPSNITTLWGKDEFYVNEYWRQFPGKSLFLCGDYATKDEDGYYAIQGRSDEVINVAAMRVSTREIADAIASHPAAAEVCVIGAADALKGEEPVGFVVLRPGFEATPQMKNEMRDLVRETVGAIAAPRDVRFVPSLPKDRNGKFMRGVIKAVYDGTEPAPDPLAGNAASPDEVRLAVEMMRQGLGK